MIDFVMVVTIGWTGMRWAETIGMQREYFHWSHYRLDWQLEETSRRFVKLPPKDDSFRTLEGEGESRIDLPPFLTDLLSRQIQSHNGRCRCADGNCGMTGLIFLGPDNGHPRRSDYSRRYWRPACDGVYPHKGGKHPRPARPVLADLTAGWPGVPVKPAWPYAIPGQPWEPPRGQGWTRLDQTQIDAERVPCPSCSAAPGASCVSTSGRPTVHHRPRTAAATATGHSTQPALASWLPVKKHLTPHGLRHGHKTWMAEDGIPEILQAERLGHLVPGMRGVYTHISDPMRKELLQTLQARWEQALRERAVIAPRSASPLLDELLRPYAPNSTMLPDCSQPDRAKLGA